MWTQAKASPLSTKSKGAREISGNTEYPSCPLFKGPRNTKKCRLVPPQDRPPPQDSSGILGGRRTFWRQNGSRQTKRSRARIMTTCWLQKILCLDYIDTQSTLKCNIFVYICARAPKKTCCHRAFACACQTRTFSLVNLSLDVTQVAWVCKVALRNRWVRAFLRVPFQFGLKGNQQL